MATIRGLADAHYLDQSRRTRATVDTVQRAWRDIPLDDLWERWNHGEAGKLADLVNRAQTGAAGSSDVYMARISAAQGVDMSARLNAGAFTSPPDELKRWLGTAPARVTYDLRRGVPGTVAKRRGQAVLNRMVGTLVQDAGREGAGAGMMITPGLDGYYRKLRTPSCDRCAILAGEYFKQELAFERHPQCDCVHVPVAEHDAYDPEMDYMEMVRERRITGLSEAERDAILNDDADIYRIVNSKRQGMRATPMWGGRAYTPHKLFRAARGDKDRYRALMMRHGYIRT